MKKNSENEPIETQTDVIAVDELASDDVNSEPKESSRLDMILECIRERKGRDVVVLDLRELTPVADYFVICSGTSSMHARSIAEHIELVCKKAGDYPFGVEGMKIGKWILMDYSTIIVHVFQDETRAFYNLERLWADAKRVETENEE